MCPASSFSMRPVYVMPSARVSFMPRGELEKPLLEQELLFISDQRNKLSVLFSLSLGKSATSRLWPSHHPLIKIDVFVYNGRAVSVKCHKLENSHIRHSLSETSNGFLCPYSSMGKIPSCPHCQKEEKK